MRCPKCKKELVSGKEKSYQTPIEHAFNPNKTDLPLRPTFVCPDQCLGGGFFDPNGSIYDGGEKFRLPVKYYCALDGEGRRFCIEEALYNTSVSFRDYARGLNDLTIEGEKDVPPRWKWKFYFLWAKWLNLYCKLKYKLRKHKAPLSKDVIS